MQRLHQSILLITSAVLTAMGCAQSEADYEGAPIYLSDSHPQDAITRLQARLNTGSFTLRGRDLEMLSSLLHELGVPIESQMRVFSRTSFQRTRVLAPKPQLL